MKLLIKFPTRERPHRFMEVFELYQNMCGYEDTEFIVSCDTDDPSLQTGVMKSYFKGFPNTKVFHGENGSKIEAVNADMEGVDFDICLLASDDMYPEVDGYGKIIVECMKEFFPDTDGVLWFNDGIQGPALNTLSIIGKKFYDRFGYIYHPAYKSLWCDKEFTEVSQNLGRCKYIDNILIRHKHFSVPNATNYDLLYMRNSRFNTPDHNTYQQRKKAGFPS
ncbi:MAG: hypothetical protein CME70_00105 [Halobacteriovorax sp.]|nr:hypothetical protein [Halobacteriovorax sp.]